MSKGSRASKEAIGYAHGFCLPHLLVLTSTASHALQLQRVIGETMTMTNVLLPLPWVFLHGQQSVTENCSSVFHIRSDPAKRHL